MKKKVLLQLEDISQDLKLNIEKLSVQSAITCADAHNIAFDKNFDPGIIGAAIDALKIRIIRCDLGLFGYDKGTNKVVKPAKSVSYEVQKAIEEKLDKSGKLNCLFAWNIADEFNISRLDVADACEKLRIKINLCQFNAF